MIVWLVVFTSVFVWSAIAPKDRLTWWLEVAPALIAVAVLAATYTRYPLTGLLYWLILIHCVILMVGGHYTYAEVPLFDWIKELTGGARNNYDKIGHFAQGFVPAMVARMAERPLILALANPVPEILPDAARAVRPDAVIATGRSDYPNQVNNVLCFPYIFRGALDVGAKTINDRARG